MKLLLVTIGILAVAFAFPNHRDDAGTSSAPASDGQSDNEGTTSFAVAQQQPWINLAFIPVEFNPSWLNNNSSGPIQPRPFFFGFTDILKLISAGLNLASQIP
uniref:Putative secreted protein n=1 Tax=Psorophora albipes TaxID=869069 RepID=T1D5I9_9DIPT